MPTKYPNKYPIFIISKGRHESMYTSRTLTRMEVPHRIAVEYHQYDLYAEALEKFNLTKYASLIKLPFSNHGLGSGPARNYVWDVAIQEGSKKHWCLDCNIEDFYKLHNNRRYIVESGSIFRAAEDFIDRYENVPLAGFQYNFFVARLEKNPAFVLNTRVYSCILIENSCKHRWRGKYNEDVDLCLRVLKDGDCIIEFIIFSQGKKGTQSVKGGNTEELYLKDKNTKDRYSDVGTINKSQMLANLHPDCVTVGMKYGRWHHWVDYSKFRANRLRLKPDAVIPQEPNNYGLRLKYFTREEMDEYLTEKENQNKA